MKEIQNLDIILRGLYEFRDTGQKVSPGQFLPSLTYASSRRMAKELEALGLVDRIATQQADFLRLTSSGVMYCENNSFSLPGESVVNITTVSVNDSPLQNV